MPLARSWVEAANDPEGEFPLNNLPCGVFDAGGESRCGVAIGNRVLDVSGLEAAGLIALPGGPHFAAPAWNAHMAAGPLAWAALRGRLAALLAEGAPERAAVGAPPHPPRGGAAAPAVQGCGIYRLLRRPAARL